MLYHNALTSRYESDLIENWYYETKSKKCNVKDYKTVKLVCYFDSTLLDILFFMFIHVLLKNNVGENYK